MIFSLDLELQIPEVMLSTSNTEKTNIRNSVIECAQSLKIQASIKTMESKTVLLLLRQPEASRPLDQLSSTQGSGFAAKQL
jgi:hypothetical protein